MLDGRGSTMEIVECTNAVEVSDGWFYGLQESFSISVGQRWYFLSLLGYFEDVGVVGEELLESFTIVKLIVISRFQIRNAFEKTFTNISASEDLITNTEFIDSNSVSLI